MSDEAIIARVCALGAREQKRQERDNPRGGGVCIGATRLALNALREAGIKASAVPVAVRITNAAYRKHEAQLEVFDPAAVYLARRDQAYSVWIGHPEVDASANSLYLDKRAKGWDGHLILAIDKTILIDLTLAQTRRRTLDVPDVLRVDDASTFFHGGEDLTFACDDEFGTEVTYSLIEDTDFLRAPDWVRFAPTHPYSREFTQRALGGRAAA